MARLTVRELDEDVMARLRVRAARHGRSMEAEVRLILAEAVADSPPRFGLGSQLRARARDLHYEELELPARVHMPRAPSLGE